MKCPSCGAKNKDEMKFCKICGAPLIHVNSNGEYDDTYNYESIPSNQGIKKSGKGIVILIICIIIVLLAIGSCVAILILSNSNHDEENYHEIETTASETLYSVSDYESTTEEVSTEEETELTTVEMISVPDVVGMSKSDAESKLDNAQLSVIVQESDDASVPGGYVISQSPVAGKSVEKGEPITIYISKAHPPQTTVSSNLSTPNYNNKYLYCCASDFATLRTRPSRSSSEIVKITTREKVEYLGSDGEFYYVAYKGEKGYVLKDFFSEDINAPLNYGTGNL